ncbi:MAG: ribosomal RNA small subunit methyltransferase A [Ignavibacteria bacterium]|nr:ribosomal RNA small subunit methyltransferase A [Ignavibacteria bacterium]
MISTKTKYETYRPKKFLGQNFLTDENLAKKIVTSLEIKPGDTVVEIGPGKGVLTKYLEPLTDDFFAVELDRHIVTELEQKYGDRINLIHKDFLKVSIEDEIFSQRKNKGRIKIIGNIPYNITTEIVFRITEKRNMISSAVLMMQKEVARRLTSSPGTKDYGILAVLIQLYSIPKILFNVPPEAFFPKPRVVSSVVRFDFPENIHSEIDYSLLSEVVKKSFGKRRKTMRNSLKEFFIEKDILQEKIEFDFNRRPESLSIEEFLKLTGDISGLLSSHNNKITS